MKFQFGATNALGEVRIGEAVIPLKLTVAALVWLQTNELIQSPRPPDFQKFYDTSVDDLPGFLSAILAAMAASAHVELSREQIAAALAGEEALGLWQLELAVKAAVVRSYAGPFPKGKENALPGDSPAGGADDGIGERSK